MKNDIEQFVKDNKDAFDDLSPDEKVWQGIESQIPKPKSSYQWLWKAAAVIFFCTSVFLYLKPSTPDNNTLQQIAVLEDQKLNSELEKVESFYIEMISTKRTLISSFQKDTGVELIEGDFELDLQKLDAMYDVLKIEFEHDPSKEVVDALVLNLLVRIDILNKKLAELDVNHEDKGKSQINA